MQTTQFNDLIGEQYEIVYMDPPWKYYGDPNKSQACGKHYPTMSFEELSNIQLKNIMAKPSVLFCWTTSSKMAECIRLITDEWKLYYRGVFQVWVKSTINGKIINGQGARPSFVKPTCEYLLVASTKEKGRTFPILSEKMANVVVAPRPGNIHSRKPAIFRDNIVELFGDKKRIELFARQIIPNWDAWGNEINVRDQVIELV